MRVTRPPTPITLDLSSEEEKRLIRVMKKFLDYEYKHYNSWLRSGGNTSEEAQWVEHFLKEIRA